MRIAMRQWLAASVLLVGATSVRSQSSSAIDVQGAIVVVGRDRVESATEDGVVAVSFVTEHRGDDRSWSSSDGPRVEVLDGRFRVRVPVGRRLRVRELTLGGRPAIADGVAFDVNPDELLTIHATWMEGILLHVLDAASGDELNGVEVVHEIDHGSIETPTHPGRVESGNAIVRGSVSPVELSPPKFIDARAVRETLWIRASGYAWQRIAVDFGRQYEATARLDRAGSVVVSLTGELPASLERRSLPARDSKSSPMPWISEEEQTPRLRLRLPPRASRSERGDLVCDLRAWLGAATLDGVAEGDYIVSVELGRTWDLPLVVATTMVSIDANEVAKATLHLPLLPPAPKPVPLSGTLHVAEGWGVDDLRLVIEPIDLPGKNDQDERRMRVSSLSEVPQRPGLRRWDAGLVQPARYRLAVDDAGFSTIVDVGATGREGVELTLAEAALLHVRLVDAATGDPVDASSEILRWCPLVESTSSDMDLWKAFRCGEDGTCELVVPAGSAEVLLHGREWRLDDPWSKFTVATGSQDVPIALVRACGVVFSLSIDGKTKPWPTQDGPEVDLEAIGHGGRWFVSAWGPDAGYRMQVTQPGRYRVSVNPGNEFLPVAPFEIDVPRSDYAQHTIALVRTN